MTEKWVEANRGQDVHGYWLSIRTNQGGVVDPDHTVVSAGHNSAMTVILDNPLPRKNELGPLGKGLLSEPQTSGQGFFHFRRPRVPGPLRSGVSGYRVFMMIVFACIVLVDAWTDQSLSAAVRSVAGLVSVIVWALTLLGSFEIGPIAALWQVMRR